MTPPPIIEVAPSQNILQYTARFIFEQYGDCAPDFSSLFVLLPHAQVTQPFNEALCRSLNADLAAIIPPWAGTLKTWTKQFASNPHSAKNDSWQLISEYSRQLLFIEALQQHPDLFKEENQWQVTQALLALFDELSLNQENIFTSAEALQQQLQQAYGLEHQHEHLLYESRLVYTLWHAWQKQLDENQLDDETTDYLRRLKNAPTAIDNQQQFICLGFAHYSKTEQDFIQYLISNNQCRVIDYASSLHTDISTGHNADNLFSVFISETFNQLASQPIRQRAQHFAEKHPEATAGAPPFSTYLAGSEEAQIRAIDYYVRLKLLNGSNNIAIISEDRKLSRRLRALLERANIQLQDKAGWSLATTQAATIIERWLECIEEDFSAYPLLDCLKSPFIHIINDEADENSFRKNIYRFEHDLIFHENVSANINQYKSALSARLKRLTHWPANTYDELINTLNYIQSSAKPLAEFYASDKNIPLSEFLDILFNSLQQLGVIQRYQNDDAGLVLLKTFEALKQSVQHADPALSWYDCRTWLGMALESQHFTPPTNNACVQLMTLEQASYLNFDCVVIAAAESRHFPGSAKNHPFFNQAVRASLGLTTWEIQRQQRHEFFNQALLSAPVCTAMTVAGQDMEQHNSMPNILLTACNEDNGEEQPVSPWLELLINFYQLAYNKKPDNRQLQQLVQSNIEVFNSDDKQLPEESSTPAPTIPHDLIPERVSASAYQRIINCPYQYFSADGLQLKPLEELSDELKKSDYGERIHLILQTFHGGKQAPWSKKYGKAFDQAISSANAKEAEQHLLMLSEKIFLSDLENNVLHRSWLYRWKKHIPAYINWQIKHQQDWAIFLSEENLEVTLDDSLNIYGRLDRIDKNKENNSHAIIDYKTGKTASQEDIDTGENVQLSTYALLDNEASEVSYLSVDSSYQKVETRSSLCGDDLLVNREENKQRLVELFKQMKDNAPLPAWGDALVCRYCNFSGLCRKAEWGE